MTAGSSLVFLGLALAGGAFGGIATLRRLGEAGPSCALIGVTGATTLAFGVLAVLPHPPVSAGAMLPLMAATAALGVGWTTDTASLRLPHTTANTMLAVVAWASMEGWQQSVGAPMPSGGRDDSRHARPGSGRSRIQTTEHAHCVDMACRRSLGLDGVHAHGGTGCSRWSPAWRRTLRCSGCDAGRAGRRQAAHMVGMGWSRRPGVGRGGCDGGSVRTPRWPPGHLCRAWKLRLQQHWVHPCSWLSGVLRRWRSLRFRRR